MYDPAATRENIDPELAALYDALGGRLTVYYYFFFYVLNELFGRESIRDVGVEDYGRGGPRGLL